MSEKARILVVDDEEGMRKIFIEYLRRHGHEAWGAASAEDAVEELSGGEWDLLIADIQLPKESASRLLERARKACPDIETILVTGYASLETALQAIELGAFSYLEKPVHEGALLKTVSNALEKLRLAKENRRLFDELRESNRSLEALSRNLEKKVEERTSELKESEKNAMRRARQLAHLETITHTLISGLDLDETLRKIATEARKLVLFHKASISLVDEENRANVVYSIPPSPSDTRLSTRNYPLQETGIEWVVKRKKTLVRNNIQGEHRFREDESLFREGIRSGIVLPLLSRGKVIGTFNLGNTRKGFFTPERVQLLTQIAAGIAIAVENASLYGRLREYSERLETMVEERTAQLKKKMKELQVTQRRLVKSEKMAAISNLIAGVAHEIKNPLNSMSFSVKNIEKALDESPRLDAERELCKESLEILHSDIERLKELVDSFIGFAKPPPTCLKPLDLHEVLQSAVIRLQGDIERKGLRLVEAYDATSTRLLADESELLQAFLNLLLNAIQAMERGGTLTVHSREGEGSTVLEVADTGGGIPEENGDKIYDIYFTTKREGAGLGLSQVYRTVDSHGWQIDFESRVGEGTRFTITIPNKEPPE